MALRIAVGAWLARANVSGIGVGVGATAGRSVHSATQRATNILSRRRQSKSIVGTIHNIVPT